MAGTTADKIRFWELEVCPLFGMATHDTLVNSAALEEQVATIHNYLVGVEGSRLTALFDFVIDLAEAALHSSEVSVISVAELSLLVLSTLLNCGTLHIVNDSFEKYTSKLRDVAAASQPSLPQEGFSKSQALKYADFIDRRLAVGRSIPNANLTTRAAPVELASFLLRKDLPGNLSAEGPRHDNDHADIAKIAIMPTPDEINSARGEYLPTTESPTWHLPGIRGRLDREFRLLREDTVGQLRDVVRSEIDHMQNEATSKEANSTRRPKKDSIQYCVYEDAVIFKIDFSKFVGPEFVIRVRQPANGRASNEERGTMTKEAAARSLKQRYDWWTVKAKKRLQPGGLVCSIDSVGSVNFFTIGDSTMRTKSDIKEKNRWREDSSNIQKPKDTLADDPNHAYMTLTLLGANTQKQLSSALDWFFQSKTKKDSRLLVEFPGVLLDSFLHTLQALQSGSSLLNMPFIDIIAPRASDGQLQDGPFLDVPPPRYLQKPGIVLDMSCLTSTGELLEHCLEAPVTAEDIQRKTQLDGTQATALVEALSRSVALIQGPPGTGKTFLGVHLLKVLLENRQNAKLGPIIIVCYTNHALDQLLEHVLDSNPKANVLRMGSRSKSERLNQLNLREASMQVDRTRAEKRSMWSTRMQVDDHSDLLDVQFEDLNLSVSPGSIIKYLRVHDPAAYTGIFGDGAVDRNDGFSTVRSSPHDAFYKWRKGEELGPYMLGGSQRLWTLPKEERDALYLQWQNESFRQTSMAIEDEYKSYEVAKQASDAVRRSVDLRCMEAADIVGMTTTGLAKNCNLLKKLKSKVILCEEAGEVLEAHMLVSFLPSIEHAILIGDHRQLRPQVQNYELSSESLRGQQFAFDRSLFERLVSPPVEGELAVPFSQLTTQRRMHPSISALIRAPLYPALEDGPNVQAYPEVAGMAQRLFWFQHQHLEDGAARGGGKAKDADSMSRTNTFEVEMTVALVSHLFKQGTYASGDIAVLTPYLGQLMLLRQRFSSKFELTFNERDTADLEVADDLGSDGTQGDGPDSDSIDNAKSAPGGKPSTISKTKLLNSVRVATVDNFQGEEAKVVVVSLVRSNEQRRCGFLRTSNRINVLLSRAKHGMYILGNSDTCSGISMWQSVISALEAEGNMGPNLPLQCPRHPERTFEASLPDHFIQFAPDGPSVCGEQCPDVKFCQVCGADDILDQTVDFIVMSTYRETDLNEDPCIFPACGHILAMSSMDGVMNMAQHYTMQETASGSVHPVALATSSCPFDMKEAKLCPNCRGSLRNIARYGRIVRRAVLDESTKRFIRWAHQQHSELASQLVKQKELFESPAASLKNGNGQKGPKKFFSGEGRSALIKELLLGVDASRFSSLVKTRNAIVSYGDKVVADEQPYKRVADLVQFALNRRDNDQPVSSQFVFDESVIQTKCSLHAELLLMRCDIMALEQVAKRIEKTLASTKRRVGEEQAPSSLTSGIEILKRLLRTKRFAGLLKEYEASIETARQGKHIKQEAESRLCCVQLCLALWKLYGWKDDDAAKGVGGVTGDAAIPEATQEPNANNGSTASKASPEAGPLSRTGLKEIAEQHLQEAQALFRDNLSLQTKIFTELVHLAAALRDIAVYRPVSADEMRAVYNAMASEFSGSGHWYTCANGHPFTVGECGMPMQQARCPECGAPVGGQQHMNAEGVQRADAIEELGRGVDHLAM
ncbi:hypothetical protein SBRCBS47491_009749 [Sporothrix bragantina]|uniref:RZ-type domain-containing protein n=1 Tax=Sporothrix bragantina TaxID=671064 RepID=A0ABP0CX82_9PEZI